MEYKIMLEVLETCERMIFLCRLKWGNSDKDVCKQIHKAEQLISKIKSKYQAPRSE